METQYKKVGNKLYVVQKEEPVVIDCNMTDIETIFVQTEFLDGFKELNPDYTEMMKPFNYWLLSVQDPEYVNGVEPAPSYETYMYFNISPLVRISTPTVWNGDFSVRVDQHLTNPTGDLFNTGTRVYVRLANSRAALEDDIDVDVYWLSYGRRFDGSGETPSCTKITDYEVKEFDTGSGTYYGVTFILPSNMSRTTVSNKGDYIFITKKNANIVTFTNNSDINTQLWVNEFVEWGTSIPEGMTITFDGRNGNSIDENIWTFDPFVEYTKGWLEGPQFEVPASDTSLESIVLKPVPLTFEAITAGTVTITASAGDVYKTISYSTDNGSTWNDITTSTVTQTFATLNIGDKLLVKGTNDSYGTASFSNKFGGTAQVKVYGNIMSLIYGDNFEGQTSFPSGSSFNFKSLFVDYTNLINASNLILPATTLTNYCYYSMFQNCTSLTTTPKLPATTLADYCYSSMFNGCTSLVTAPDLPATTLTIYCYQFMFKGCTSLSTAPELPATTLNGNCYKNMFYGCTSLVTAPDLPATTLVNSCYNNMFHGCTSLNYIKAMFTTNPGMDTYDWVNGVSQTGTFVKNPEATWDVTGANGIPDGWEIVYPYNITWVLNGTDPVTGDLIGAYITEDDKDIVMVTIPEDQSGYTNAVNYKDGTYDWPVWLDVMDPIDGSSLNEYFEVSSSNTSVINVTGEHNTDLEIKGVGTTTITTHFIGSSSYEESTMTFTIEVIP